MATKQKNPAIAALNAKGAAMNKIYGVGPTPVLTKAAKAAIAARNAPVVKKKPVVVKAKPLTVRQQAIQQVNAVNQASMANVNQTAAKTIKDAKAQAQQALGFEHALNEISQGDAGRIYDAYQNAAAKVSAYGDLALSSAGSSSESAAAQAQNYLASVGPDVGAETRPDIAGALRALGATAVGDVAGALSSQGAYAQERARNVRNAQLMRLSDIGANAMYQGADRAGQLRSDELARASGARAADVNAAISAIKGETRAGKAETRAEKAERRAQGEYVRAGTLATNTEKRAAAAEGRAVTAEGRAVTAEERAVDDQRMKDLAFDVELNQRKVDLATSKLTNAKGAIEIKQAQFELDNAQDVLDASLAQQEAETAGTIATTANTKADTAATELATIIAKKNGGKTLTPYEQATIIAKAHDEAKEMFTPPAPTNPLAKKTPRTNYKDALNRLMGKYGLTKLEAADVLDVYYKTPGEDGRPVFDTGEQAQLIKLGFTKAEINQASNGYGKAKRTGVKGPGYDLFEKMLDRLGGGGKFGDATGGSIFGGKGPGG